MFHAHVVMFQSQMMQYVVMIRKYDFNLSRQVYILSLNRTL